MANPSEKILVRVRAYIDMLNLYHRTAKKNKFKWIDIKGLLLDLIQLYFDEASEGEFQVEIEKIYLFTSEIRGDDNAARVRQHAHLCAMKEKYGDSLEIVKGRMVPVKKPWEPVDDEIKNIVKNKKGIMKIRTYEEKQTDVNIGCQMVEDAYIAAEKAFDIACLVSNDSDLIPPLGIKKRLEQRVLVMFPLTEKNKEQASKDLKKCVSEDDRIPCIPRAVLLNNRLPLRVGRWHCPDKWKKQDEEERERRGEAPPE